MSSKQLPLPEYQRPPVIELALGLQFEPLEGMGVVHPGLIWERFRERYPKYEQQAPLAPSLERFGERAARSGRLTIEVDPGSTLPRVWFVTADDHRLLQFQRDRFVFNWRRAAGGEDYPRYQALRAEFEREFAAFAEVVEQERLGSLRPTQCEITYVNELREPRSGGATVDLTRVLTTWAAPPTSDFPLPLEHVSQEMRYVIPGDDGSPAGRLRVVLQPVLDARTNDPAYLFHLSVQGPPRRPGIKGVFEFIDASHDWIVRCFTAITTPHMHQLWGRVR